MTYEEMTSYLSTHPLEDLSTLTGVPRSTLNRFLIKKGFSTPTIRAAVKRPRINPLMELGTDSPFSGNEELTDVQRQIIHGSLFGDMYAGDVSPYLRCEHAWGQIGYLKAL